MWGGKTRGWAASAGRLDDTKWRVILHAAVDKMDWTADEGDIEEGTSGATFDPRSLIEICTCAGLWACQHRASAFAGKLEWLEVFALASLTVCYFPDVGVMKRCSNTHRWKEAERGDAVGPPEDHVKAKFIFPRHES
ncbi:hypothetical protein BYT27DRAFT_7206109 [Phlegmacium glaucopus]|nr:hypothetical protein BYT27DRAFT_7206109 [Phlegmacium glaucopus]